MKKKFWGFSSVWSFLALKIIFFRYNHGETPIFSWFWLSVIECTKNLLWIGHDCTFQTQDSHQIWKFGYKWNFKNWCRFFQNQGGHSFRVHDRVPEFFSFIPCRLSNFTRKIHEIMVIQLELTPKSNIIWKNLGSTEQKLLQALAIIYAFIFMPQQAQMWARIDF